MKYNTRNVIRKIQNNLEREDFRECYDIRKYEKSSMYGEEVFESDSEQISFLTSSQTGYAKCVIEPKNDSFTIEWDWDDLDDLETEGSRQYSSLSELDAFISDYFFYDWNIIPSEEELKGSKVVVTIKFELNDCFEEDLNDLIEIEDLYDLYKYLDDYDLDSEKIAANVNYDIVNE